MNVLDEAMLCAEMHVLIGEIGMDEAQRVAPEAVTILLRRYPRPEDAQDVIEACFWGGVKALKIVRLEQKLATAADAAGTRMVAREIEMLRMTDLRPKAAPRWTPGGPVQGDLYEGATE